VIRLKRSCQNTKKSLLKKLRNLGMINMSIREKHVFMRFGNDFSSQTSLCKFVQKFNVWFCYVVGLDDVEMQSLIQKLNVTWDDVQEHTVCSADQSCCVGMKLKTF